MNSDKTMRILWYKGRPYGISTAPFGPSSTTGQWYVLLVEGWEPLFPSTTSDQWPDIEQRALDWLESRERSME
jgi:hypothetical protein